jgi:ComF family protein
MLQTLLDFVFPRVSLTGESGLWITEKERARLQSTPIRESKEQLQKRGVHFLDHVTAASGYHDSWYLQRAIATLKYGRVRALAPELVTLMLSAKPDALRDAVLCPVPLHWSRLLERGFNQTDLLTSELAKRTGVESLSLLRRTRATGHQAWRGREERLVSMHDAFRFVGKCVPTRVFLVDDLITTGATLDAAAKALKDAGVGHVEAWVVAHG